MSPPGGKKETGGTRRGIRSVPWRNYLQHATNTISNSAELLLHKTSSFATDNEASSSADRTLGHQLLDCTFDSLQRLIYILFGVCR